MAIYDKALKESLIQRMMQNESVTSLSKETGIAEVTLYKWKKTAKDNGITVSVSKINSEQWSTQDKFMIVVETATLSEIELANYCRSKGLYVEEVQSWRNACLQANGGVAQQATKLQKELRDKEKEIQQLSKELKRKESALAETAALLVLRKKASAIWGENEED